MPLDNEVTILIPTSPIPRHPATDLIEECIKALRFYFPVARIIIMADGVRPSVEHRRAQYQEYLKNLSKLVNGNPENGLERKLGNTELLIFNDFSQQVIMTRNVLHHHVHTPLIMFVEHDAIMKTEEPIKFEAIFNLLLSGEANLSRFYNWDDIWHEHQSLMRGEFEFQGARFVKTVQYSQWPLVSRTDYHKKILNEIVPGEQDRRGTGRYTMIEPVVYYQVASAPWEDNKIVIYIDGKRCFTHVDGRVDVTTGRKDPGEW